MDTRLRYGIMAVAVVTILIVSMSLPFSSVSGYQSMTAEWYQVRWDYPLEFSPNPYSKDLSGAYVTWDGDETDSVSKTGGWSNLNAYSAETSDPKYDSNLDYNDWWLNDTVTESNPNGDAKHYEWSIDRYTLNVNFATLSGDVGCDAQSNNGYGAEFWLELQNNYESVFRILGAEGAVSYVLYAEVDVYEWAPSTAANHRILPSVDKFDIMFLDGTTALPPDVPEEGSDLNFATLEQFSHVALRFSFAQFGRAGAGTDVTVHYVINLSVLTIGRFDYRLTYVEGGDNSIAPIGNFGLLDGIGAALGAGYSALMDGFADLGSALVAPLFALGIVIVCVIVLIMVWRRK